MTESTHEQNPRRPIGESARPDATYRPHGLRATPFPILAVLAQMGPAPIGEVAYVGLERTTLTRSASMLETRGGPDGAKLGIVEPTAVALPDTSR